MINQQQLGGGSKLLPYTAFSDSRKGCPYGFYQMKLYAELSLPLTWKVARRRRVGRRESTNRI